MSNERKSSVRELGPADEVLFWQEKAEAAEAENERLQALAERVLSAHATYAYAEPNYGTILALKQEARTVLSNGTSK